MEKVTWEVYPPKSVLYNLYKLFLESTDGRLEFMNKMRNYSQPILFVLQGEKGARAFRKIATSEPVPYDAVKEAEKAAKKLRKQGFIV